MKVKKNTKNNSFRRILGNILIISSLGVLLFTYYPWIHMYIVGSGDVIAGSEINGDESFIYIPKIGARADIIPSVNPWDEKEYHLALEKGVAQAKGFSKPGEEGIIFLFAHSSALPWNMTRQNTPFLKLGNLESGDEINIKWEGKGYKYQVEDKKEVWPEEVNMITQTKGNWLILQTCTPVGTSLKRLLIFAKPM